MRSAAAGAVCYLAGNFFRAIVPPFGQSSGKTIIMRGKTCAKTWRRRGLSENSAGMGAGLAAAPASFGSAVFASAAAPVKIGHIDSTTGNFAVLGQSQIKGAQLAAKELNAKGGILGRPVQVLVEDDAGSPAPAIDKAGRLLDQEKVDFFIGTTSSAVSLSLSQFAQAHNKMFMCTGGHVDKLTGLGCNWATFRVCSTTWILTQGNSKTLVDKFGKKWYFLTTDYAFGHSEQADYTKQVTALAARSWAARWCRSAPRISRPI